MTKEQAVMKLKEHGFVPVYCIKADTDGSYFFACTYDNKPCEVDVSDQYGVIVAPT